MGVSNVVCSIHFTEVKSGRYRIMSDEEAISLSDPESEGEGPNIRPPQAGGSYGKKHHKQKHRDRDLWRQNRHREERADRDRERRKNDLRGRDDRHRRNERDRDRSSGGRRVADTTDLRHRLNKDK